ncbi:MAG: FAD-dependent oxidoreductase [Chloroflexi bacterium]|nr:FAD-dependent oxidoreductase [Chloroflexota bacterium]MDA1239352.1 FAD-dependent oxidoreductase [Chloroflexota bacterium]
MPERLVIIGGDAAGMTAATNARRMKAADALEIVAFERSDWISFSACGEPYYVSGEVMPFERLLVRSVEDFARGGITVHKRHEVTAIDLGARSVTVRDHAGERDLTVEYDHLVYATGARARRLPIEGYDLAGVHEMHVLDDALAVRAIVEAGPKRVVVVGGGFVGIEMAEAFHVNGIETTVVTSGAGLLDGAFDDDFSERITEAVRALGIRVLTGQRVECLHGEGGRVTSVGCEEQAIPADVVLFAAGTVPNVELARGAGLRIGESGGVWVDGHMRTSAAGVYAAGDCAESTHRISGQPVNLHLGTLANRQGRVAGFNIGGGDEVFPGVLGTAITKCLDLEIARTGLTEVEARAAGFDAVAVTFESPTKAGYWPSSTRMSVKAIGDRTSRRLLGVQIAGGPTAGKRVDAMAVALWAEMTVDDFLNADLAYAPPFSGVWDPMATAARLLQSALDRPEPSRAR